MRRASYTRTHTRERVLYGTNAEEARNENSAPPLSGEHVSWWGHQRELTYWVDSYDTHTWAHGRDRRFHLTHCSFLLLLSLSLALSLFISSRPLLSSWSACSSFLRIGWNVDEPNTPQSKFARASYYLVVDFRYSLQINFQRRSRIVRDGTTMFSFRLGRSLGFLVFTFVRLISRKLITVRYIFPPSSMEVGLTHRGSVQQETLVRRSRRKSTNKSASRLNSDRPTNENRVRAVSAIVDSRIFPRGALTRLRHDAK